MDVFHSFTNTPYTFLKIKRGKTLGNVIEEETDALGVFKLRNGLVSVNNQETRQSDATLHVKPSESFAAIDMVGNGIRENGITYEIVGQTGGKNFDTGVLEHYRLTLQRAKFVESS